MTWTRENDRIIAEKCEGLRVVVDGDGYWVTDDRGKWEPLPKYREYLPHTVQAAEAWRKGDQNNRYWVLESAYVEENKSHAVAHQINASCPDQFFDGYSPAPAAALAHALYQAVTG
jgi:hypothetical protein